MPTEMKVAFIGYDSVGKTSIIYRLIENKFINIWGTSHELTISEKTIKMDDHEVKIDLVDYPGHPTFHAKYAPQLGLYPVIFMIYDVTDRESFRKNHDFLYEIHHHAYNSMVILVGSKCDGQREISKEEGQQYADEQRQIIAFYEVSAKTGQGVLNMFLSGVNEHIRRVETQKANFEQLQFNR